MASKNPSTLISLPVRWTGGAFTVTVADDYVGATRPVTVIPSGTLWTRTYLAPTTGGTAEATPTDLLRYIQTALNAATGGANPWTVALQTSGLVRISYAGASAATITWGASTAVRNALGFASNISVGAAGALPQTAEHHPAFCWFIHTLEGDKGNQAEPSMLIGAMAPTGQEVVWSEGKQLVRRTAKAKFTPSTEAIRGTLSRYGTPYWPPEDEPTRYTDPTLVPESVASTGWTVHETLSVVPGTRLAYAPYTLQTLIAGGSTRYHVGAIPSDSVKSMGTRAELTIPAYTSLVDVPSFDLTFTTTETR
jgi:hypothetical protein